METHYYLELIYKSLSERITLEEKKELNLWRQQDMNNEREYNELKQVWDSAIEIPSSTSRPIDKIILEIRSQERDRHQLRLNTIRIKMMWIVLSSALFFILCATAFLTFIFTPYQNVKGSISLLTDEKTIMWLPDSSSVTLRKGAMFQFEYSQKCRTIFLNGEGYFSVDQKDDRPFIVYAGNSVIEARASKFFVQQVDDMPFRVVLIDDGNLEVEHDGKEVILQEHHDMAIVRSGLKKERLLEEGYQWLYD